MTDARSTAVLTETIAENAADARSTAVLIETITQNPVEARSTAVLIEVIASVSAPVGGGILLVGL